MTSFLIVSRDKQKRITYAKDFCTKQKIDPFDISLVEKDNTVKQNANSIGIDDVKRIQKTVYLKPLKSNFKAIILEDAHLLTTEAQNALLKVLEEPPEHTLLLLGADRKEALLPTILSRCQLIELGTEAFKLTPKDQKDIAEFIQALPTMSIGEKLKKAEALAKDKDKALVWIEKVIVVIREKLISNVILVSETHPESQNGLQNDARDSGHVHCVQCENLRCRQARMTMSLRSLRSLQSLHTLLKTTNVNPRFAIENTLLHL
jgi:hypothetical protein